MSRQGIRCLSRAEAADIRSNIPIAVYWSDVDVANWIEENGFPQYKRCFLENFITGRKLIAIDASSLPKMGIHDFEHIKQITALVRDLLGIPKYLIKREVQMRDPRIAYLELKRRTGREMDSTTFNIFLFDNRHFFPQKRKSFSH
ncbi:sterile alpha motif domain-containing protein 15-like [Saccostrea echinata]|uniref:sterile alpha motif domain-containing protein 15-like n=1 Tax=Saccostrea echinata TaxID=191078 RepID=UPI002A823428|nr:sterile alpha motif domain-containing protein 15-like [Saccostrea echinata]